MRTTIAIILTIGLTACNRTELAGHATGPARDPGKGGKNDLLQNSAFQEPKKPQHEVDHHNGLKPPAAGGQLGQEADFQAATKPTPVIDLNPNAPPAAIDVLRVCSNLYTKKAQTNLKASVGVVASLIPQAGQRDATPIHFHDPATARELKASIMNSGRFNLPMKDVRGGAYLLVLCDINQALACRNAVFRPSGMTDRFGGQRGMIASAMVTVSQGAFTRLIGSLGTAGGKIEVLTDKNVELSNMQNSFFNMFNQAISHGSGLPPAPPLPTSAEGIEDCDESASPLIVNLDNQGFRFSPPYPGKSFDLDADGKSDLMSWPKKEGDLFIVLDRNGNGTIDDGSEMFGNNTLGTDDKKSANGFLALAEYDSNKDGMVDADDPVFARLRLLGHDDKLDTLDARGIAAIDLAFVEDDEVDEFKNSTKQRSVVRLKSGEWRMIADVWFRKLRP